MRKGDYWAEQKSEVQSPESARYLNERKVHASVATVAGHVYVVSFPTSGEDVHFPSEINGSSITNVQISDGAEKIGEQAFQGCTGLVDISIPNSRTIGMHATQLNLRALADYADYLITYGTSSLAVKLGLIILAGFNFQFIEEVMLTFGAYDEFTYFAARTLSQPNWRNGNKQLFDLAKNVYGWGRIHAVEYLKPDSQEIRDWLLYEGSENDIISQYSADVCLQKAGVQERLSSIASLSKREFDAIGKLIGYTLEDGPCPGITDADQILPMYLKAAADYPIDRTLIQKILDKGQKYYHNPKLIDVATQLLNKKDTSRKKPFWRHKD